jgi:hypothetical protein
MTVAPTTRSAWGALLFSIIGFPLAVLAGFGIFAGFGLCMESSKELCTDASAPWPSWWHLVIIYVIAWVLVAGPAVLALKRGLRARKAGAPKALPVIVVSGILIALISVVLGSGLW